MQYATSIFVCNRIFKLLRCAIQKCSSIVSLTAVPRLCSGTRTLNRTIRVRGMRSISMRQLFEASESRAKRRPRESARPRDDRVPRPRGNEANRATRPPGRNLRGRWRGWLVVAQGLRSQVISNAGPGLRGVTRFPIANATSMGELFNSSFSREREEIIQHFVMHLQTAKLACRTQASPDQVDSNGAVEQAGRQKINRVYEHAVCFDAPTPLLRSLSNIYIYIGTGSSRRNLKPVK